MADQVTPGDFRFSKIKDNEILYRKTWNQKPYKMEILLSSMIYSEPIEKFVIIVQVIVIAR